MNSFLDYFIILAGISLHILHHQRNHILEVKSGRAMLNPFFLTLINISVGITLLSLFGLSIYFGVKFGWLTALKFVGLAILVQFPIAIVVFGLRLHRFAWAISLSGIILLPIFMGIMLYVSFYR